eukprot:TRINITY_DN4510_c0_g1_i1.p1 TRINITY_DN4510_c0_g1~~TRINITY_DN4510_c0_g1_i1.p1  ORF type:complete len:127 (+),score=29.78 TRINITY_DN4510_c0_g1_i1:278-658(+)
MSELRTHNPSNLRHVDASTVRVQDASLDQERKKEAACVDLMQELRSKFDDKRTISSNSPLICKKEAACVSLMRDIRSNNVKSNLRHVMAKPGRLAFLKSRYEPSFVFPEVMRNLMREIRVRVPLAL